MQMEVDSAAVDELDTKAEGDDLPDIERSGAYQPINLQSALDGPREPKAHNKLRSV